MKKCTLHTWSGLTVLCLAALLMVSAVNAATEALQDIQEVDLVWTKSDGIRPEIFYTNRVAGSWSEPVMVTDDFYDNNHPVIDRDSEGTRWVFWTAYDNYRTEIRYTTGSGGEWEDDKPLASEMKSNSGPSVAVDRENTVWVAWSASDEGLDDIYYALNKDGEWSEARILHEPNETPDTLPVVGLDEEGGVVVTWKQLRGGDYIELTSSYDGSKWSQPAVTEVPDEPVNDDSEEDLIVLPDYIGQSGMVFIRAY